MQSAELAIVYEPERGRPLTVARVADRRLLIAVARAAIAQAEERASAIAQADRFLGTVQHEDAARIRRVLTILLPELCGLDPQLERAHPEADDAPDA